MSPASLRSLLDDEALLDRLAGRQGGGSEPIAALLAAIAIRADTPLRRGRAVRPWRMHRVVTAFAVVVVGASGAGVAAAVSLPEPARSVSSVDAPEHRPLAGTVPADGSPAVIARPVRTLPPVVTLPPVMTLPSGSTPRTGTGATGPARATATGSTDDTSRLAQPPLAAGQPHRDADERARLLPAGVSLADRVRTASSTSRSQDRVSLRTPLAASSKPVTRKADRGTAARGTAARGTGDRRTAVSRKADRGTADRGTAVSRKADRGTAVSRKPVRGTSDRGTAVNHKPDRGSEKTAAMARAWPELGPESVRSWHERVGGSRARGVRGLA